MELLYDEYGGGDPNRLHAHLFAVGLEASGLRAEYGAYIDDVPLEILELNNAMSLFGLHRRLRAAALGHLAAFEATSSLPSRRMARARRASGFPPEMIGYYEEHVEADAVHEQLAVRTICGALVEAEPHSSTTSCSGRSRASTSRTATPAHARRVGGMTECRTFEHPDVIVCPGGPLLLRGEHLVEDADGTRTGRATGERRVPVRQVRRPAVVRRHPQGAPGPRSLRGEQHPRCGSSGRSTSPRQAPVSVLGSR